MCTNIIYFSSNLNGAICHADTLYIFGPGLISVQEILTLSPKFCSPRSKLIVKKLCGKHIFSGPMYIPTRVILSFTCSPNWSTLAISSPPHILHTSHNSVFLVSMPSSCSGGCIVSHVCVDGHRLSISRLLLIVRAFRPCGTHCWHVRHGTQRELVASAHQKRPRGKLLVISDPIK